MIYTEQQLWEAFESLPLEIKKIMFSVDFARTIKVIGDRNRLHIDQLSNFGEEVGLVMLGLSRPEDFLTQIQSRLNIPIEVAGEIVKQTNTEIFYPIRESLKKLHQTAEEKEIAYNVYSSEPIPKIEPISGPVNVTTVAPTPSTPAQASQPAGIGQAMFEQKMGNLFHLEKEEKSVGGETTTGNVLSPTAPDPYHESIG